MSQDIRERIELQRLLKSVQALFGLEPTANLATDAQTARARVERLHAVVRPVLEDAETQRLLAAYAGSGR